MRGGKTPLTLPLSRTAISFSTISLAVTSFSTSEKRNESKEEVWEAALSTFQQKFLDSILSNVLATPEKQGSLKCAQQTNQILRSWLP